jgi:hypothetical protein
MLRGTSFIDGIDVSSGAMATNYHIDIVAWILPS